MGCCLSSNNTTSNSPTSKTPQISNTRCTTTSKSPPPTHPLPEETVKEVLTESETPTVSKPSRISSPFIKSAPLLTTDFHKSTFQHKMHKKGAVFTALGNDEVSEEVSEVCSTLSESVSVSKERREKDDVFREVRQRSPAKLKNRSFSGEIVTRDTTVGRSPGRRSEPSPGRVRPGPGYGRRSEIGESSGRRSRSPATRGESGLTKAGLGRTQSTRKTGKSPGRVGSSSGERIRRVGQVEGGDSKWPAPRNNELLENPLVSLECFIFL